MGKKRDIILAAAVLLCIWEIAAVLLHSMALPEPWVVLRETGRKLWQGQLLFDTGISCLRALAGIAVALTFAIPIGIATGAEKRLRRYFSPFIYLLYPIPHVVLLPLIIILFGIGEMSKILLIALIVFFQILVTTRDAAKNIHGQYLLVMQSLNASRSQIYRHVLLPAALPEILTALRISVGTAIAILFFVESFATTKGLGYIIMDSWGQADYVTLYSAIICMATLGFGLYVLIDRLERRICRWKKTT